MRIEDAKRVVIKVGTSTLTYPSGHIHLRLVERLIRVIADIRNSGREVVLVSSGAIGVGVGKLGLRRRPDTIPEKQAAAAVGQCELMYLYDRYFSEYNHTVSQVLVTKYSFTEAEAKSNVHNTFEALFAFGAIPIVNENDTVATDEIKIGDNDTLSAIVAELVGADCLVILSDIDGLYSADPQKDPNARLIAEVPHLTEEVLHSAGGAGSSRGTGGMITKLQAAQICARSGIDMYILNGKNPDLLYDLLDGNAVGTHFHGE